MKTSNRKRHKATPEQIARRAQQRDAVKQIAARIRAMSDGDRIAFASKYGLRHVDGHELSIKNQCLILMQNPNATVCGGFGQWIKAGRCVRKGEHGFLHWVPIGRKTINEQTGEQLDADERPGFILAPTFDIAQTKAMDEPDAEPITTTAEANSASEEMIAHLNAAVLPSANSLTFNGDLPF